MAIEAIFGKPGAGKSYTAVKDKVLPAIRQGRKIITNLPLNLEYIRKCWPMLDPGLIEVREPTSDMMFRFSDVSEFQDTWRSENGYGPLYIIDEAHNAFPRVMDKSKSKELLQWFTMHRHTGADVVLVSQQANQVWRDLTGLIQTVTELNNASNLGFGKKRYTKAVRDGMKGALIAKPMIHSYDTSIFRFYSSYTKGASGEDKKEARSIFLSPFFLAFYAFFALIVLLVVFLNPFKVLNPKEMAKPKPVEVTAPAAALADSEKEDPPVGAEKRREVIVTPPREPSPSKQLYVSPPPAEVPALPEEPEEPEYDDGELVIEAVEHVTMARLGNKCRGFPVVNGRQTEAWEWSMIGWKVENIPNEGRQRDEFGSCTLRLTRGDHVMEWYSDPLAVFTPPKRFGGRKVSDEPPFPSPPEGVGVIAQVNGALEEGTEKARAAFKSQGENKPAQTVIDASKIGNPVVVGR